MGMFDWVEFEMHCPFCDAKLNEFQTKDTECILDTVKLSDCRSLIGHCSDCDLFIKIEKITPAKENQG